MPRHVQQRRKQSQLLVVDAQLVARLINMLFQKLRRVLRYAMTLSEEPLGGVSPLAGVAEEVLEIHEVVELELERPVAQVEHPLDLGIRSHIALVLLVRPALARTHLLVHQVHLLSQLRVPDILLRGNQGRALLG